MNHEYHLIDLAVGLSQGGFETLAGARQFAREEGLRAWDIFHGNARVEYHDPRGTGAKLPDIGLRQRGYWRRRPETKAVLPALFSVTCLPTIGAWAASDWSAEVIHHLGWPHR
jgi:hypothetical protein